MCPCNVRIAHETKSNFPARFPRRVRFTVRAFSPGEVWRVFSILMSNFQICCCGSAPGYPHRADCPRPLFNATDSQFEQWEKEWLALKEQTDEARVSQIETTGEERP